MEMEQTRGVVDGIPQPISRDHLGPREAWARSSPQCDNVCSMLDAHLTKYSSDLAQVPSGQWLTVGTAWAWLSLAAVGSSALPA